jgi:putative glutamine amidotransferase
MRPVIGICSYLETMRWGAWEDRAAMVPAGYLGAVQRAGGLAVLLPPDPEAARDPDPVLDLLDGLILAGGVDVDPATYGASALPTTDPPNTERDAFELALARRALERDLPLLGICRGMQVMNVAAGGTLHQHVDNPIHRRTLGQFVDHEVRLEDGSLAARAAGETVHPSKSHHHQAVDALGEGFVVTGRSPQDDLPEAIEDPARRYALGVQWHPEADETSRLIGSLVSEARAAASTRA